MPDASAVLALPRDFDLGAYDFALPQELIAQRPPATRGSSRLMLVDRAGKRPPRHARFSELPALLEPGTLLVANNSRVVRARLKGTRTGGGRAEFLLLTPPPLIRTTRDGDWNVAEAGGLLRPAKRLPPGREIAFGPDLLLTVLEHGPFGQARVRLRFRGRLQAILDERGSMPLPPYIRREAGEEDLDRYQTCYSDPGLAGSVAAPTAGLHFTPAIRQALLDAGCQWAEVTLYVGYGTFSPVRCGDIRMHAMHAEHIHVPGSTARAVALARSEGRKVLAVGTTSARALEGAARAAGPGRPYAGETDIFIYPGQPVSVVDGLLTNFHLPGSTLLMLVSALAGRENILSAYACAVENRYRFFSYGDAMLII